MFYRLHTGWACYLDKTFTLCTRKVFITHRLIRQETKPVPVVTICRYNKKTLITLYYAVS